MMKIYILLFLCFSLFDYLNSFCLEIVCTDEYKDFLPALAQGQCGNQNSKVDYLIKNNVKASGCAKPVMCYGKDKHRYWCNCKQIDRCTWAAWGSWTGSIPTNRCGQERRRRMGIKKFSYVGASSCSKIIADCPRSYEDEYKDKCSCKKADVCTPQPWTSWTPAVRNGCVKQTRRQERSTTYKYVVQKNCDDINPNCPATSIDNRLLCNCPYKECTEMPSWSSWQYKSWVGICQQERRFKSYRSQTKYKIAYKPCNLLNLPQSCPASSIEQVRERDVRCSYLPVPTNGYHTAGSTCNGGNIKCRSACSMKCNPGYEVVGNHYVMCKGDGRWSGPQGTCVEINDLKIFCPTLAPFPNSKDTAFRIITLPSATVSSKIKYSIKMSHPIKVIKVLIGAPVNVLYTATDVTGRTASCRIQVVVKDTEPPKIISCPKNILRKTTRPAVQVIWKEPEFYDNVDKTHIRVVPDHDKGNFAIGKYVVNYRASDQSDNVAYCTFTVEVKLLTCPQFSPPQNGLITCNLGITVCTAACKTNMRFDEGSQKAKLYNHYVCMNGKWRGQTTPSAYFVPLPDGRSPWPNCIAGSSTRQLMKSQIFHGSCRNKNDLDQLKKDYISDLSNDWVLNGFFSCIGRNNCKLNAFFSICSSQKTGKKRSVEEFDEIYV